MGAHRRSLRRGTCWSPSTTAIPTLGNFRLFLVRRRANDQEDKIGSLLVNPGGPGASGASFARGADFRLGTELLDRFDVIGWDPRGTYDTAPAIDCIDDYDEYLTDNDITPDSPEARQHGIDVAKEFQDLCVEKNGPILQHVGTNNSARDMDSIRRALGEDKISYFGFSYGSELGATWATLFPDTVRAAVLDGAKDPNAGSLEWDRQQRVGFEHTLGLYLDDCAQDSDCAFHNEGFTREAFDEVMDNIDAHPLPTKAGRPDLTRGMALQAVAMAMYEDALWDQLSDALADAQQGDGEALLILYDTYYSRMPDGTWPNLLEAFQVIVCMDSDDRPTVEEYDANALEVSRLAPRFSPGTVGGYDCAWFPRSEDPRVSITGAGAGPIVVIGTTGDPATPLAGTRRWRPPCGTGGWSSSTPTSTPATARTRASSTSSTGTSSTSRRRPRGPTAELGAQPTPARTTTYTGTPASSTRIIEPPRWATTMPVPTAAVAAIVAPAESAVATSPATRAVSAAVPAAASTRSTRGVMRAPASTGRSRTR